MQQVQQMHTCRCPYSVKSKTHCPTRLATQQTHADLALALGAPFLGALRAAAASRLAMALRVWR